MYTQTMGKVEGSLKKKARIFLVNSLKKQNNVICHIFFFNQYFTVGMKVILNLLIQFRKY